MKNNMIYYSVGALLYCPANHPTVADSIIQEKFERPFSLALCLEDTIRDGFVAQAEHMLIGTLQKIDAASQSSPFYLPKIFIRVRTPEQIRRLSAALGDAMRIITGFIMPKFSPDNAAAYTNEMIRVNSTAARKLYMMPIYESDAILDLRKRAEILCSLKDILDQVSDLVLNIRVGGNDLCNLFGFRRHIDESIHRIRPVADIFSDIITVYAADYVISGPVWEYYSREGWEQGLKQEIQDDQLCGFIGKTVIHPAQIPVVNHCCQVPLADYEDACAVLNWNRDTDSMVAGSILSGRMNEYKTHINWAERTLYLAEYFGVAGGS